MRVILLILCALAAGPAVAQEPPSQAALREALFAEDYERFSELYQRAEDKNAMVDGDGNVVSYLEFAFLVQDPRFFDLVVQSADPNFAGVGDMPPLSYTSMRCEDQRAKQLLERGADVNYASSLTGSTPLHSVAVSDCFNLARLLRSAGADLSIKTRDGDTAADLARRKGNARMARLLTP